MLPRTMRSNLKLSPIPEARLGEGGMALIRQPRGCGETAGSDYFYAHATSYQIGLRMQRYHQPPRPKHWRAVLTGTMPLTRSDANFTGKDLCSRYREALV